MYSGNSNVTQGPSGSSNSLLLIFVSVILLGTLTGCSSTHHRKESLVKILEQQSVVIEKLQNERNVTELFQKIKKDHALSRAETNLMEALNALKTSSELVKTEVQKH